VLVEHMHWMLRPFQGLEPPMKMDSDESRTEMEDGFGRVSFVTKTTTRNLEEIFKGD
jgi:hypothetical protein